ncbi:MULTISPECIES: MarR family winged helix-turn-helix transcriptional regulator [unclassified Idiomarina]|jgi:DNA-binding MarR family transcriptional regulator|uniref:MarR family winged helix-turn-helix transcriptional regulator n=1 Tax=unclassified Idiomarina TaxID=2614829 RepID=UPI0008F9387C|nr:MULTISPECIES: MarR family transcriptional regulator [unclassified Idiomarina]MAD52721.1 MarR family transcriptional regulator [Idiomarinaceae bacterium]MEC7644204.1 MarR family transcriptional regulator [Pseudomonadota bacterium]NQZ04350.1 MarR family transcriptional regulator [Idiomarina sp.]OIN01930.1 transcriptional regulator [Idiomarina sp. MD25a]|tara:strand:- start:2656 stop:3141 length:486 start_codon:yes stop_codon:yes gene_type:complete
MEKYEELLLALRKVIRAIDLHSKQLNKYSGLTAPQLLILREIVARDGITASEVAQNITLSPATVSNVIERMEHRGLIYRRRSNTDKRRVLMYITEQGQSLLAQAPQPLQEDFIEKFQGLDEWEQSLLLSSMQRIATMMDAERLDAAPVLEVGSYHKMDKHS